MKSNFNDDSFWSELCECSNIDNSIGPLNSQVSELKQYEAGEFKQSYELTSLHDDPHYEAYMTTQVAWQDNEIMEDANFIEEESCSLLKDLITETTNSSPYFQDISQSNVVDYVSEDGDVSPTSPNPIIASSYEKPRDSSQNHNPLDNFPTDDFPIYMNDTSDGVLNKNCSTLGDAFMGIDDLTTISGRYGVLSSIQKTAAASISFDRATSFGATANMCLDNDKLSHWLGQHLTGPFPGLIDLTDMDPIVDVPIALVPKKTITLVLDLDETLVHSAMSDDGADFSVPVFHGAKEYTVYVKKRPYVDTFLQKVADMFEIVIFTASLCSYANRLLDMLDPENKLFSQRFFRESCVSLDGNYLKDLTVIEADLAKVAIIDNLPEVFQLQVNNGIPIKSWFNDPSDMSLLELIPFLETLAAADDVRPIISNKFGN